jgi:hypothetical protein
MKERIMIFPYCTGYQNYSAHIKKKQKQQQTNKNKTKAKPVP